MKSTVKKQTVKIELEVDVTGIYTPYYPSRDGLTPPEEPTFEITNVTLGDLDITKELDKLNFDFCVIEDAILNNE